MNKILTITSISLNLVLLFILLFLANKLGYLGRTLVVFDANAIELPTDTLSSQPWWQDLTFPVKSWKAC